MIQVGSTAVVLMKISLENLAMKILITATFISIMTAPFAFAGDCSTHSDQAMTCDTGTTWDAEASVCVDTSA